MAQIGNVSADQLIAGSSVLSRPAEEFENDPTIESMWAMKAYEHAEIYFNLLHDAHRIRIYFKGFLECSSVKSKFSGGKINALNESKKDFLNKVDWQGLIVLLRSTDYEDKLTNTTSKMYYLCVKNEKTILYAQKHNHIVIAIEFFQILCSVDPKLLKLTPHDDQIYKTFREYFPDLKVDIIVENDLKSEQGKQKWRPYCEQFKNVVEDYNFGTMLRIDCKGEYSEENSILTTRIQFYAIEIARNREGFNDAIRDLYKPRKTTEKL